MKRFAMILSTLFALAAGHPSAAPAQTPGSGPSEKLLAQYRDKNRVLLVFAPTAQDAAFREQNKLWSDEKAGFKERQLVLLPLLKDSPDARENVAQLPVLKDAPEARDAVAQMDSGSVAALAKRFNVDTSRFIVVLIGKDGHDAYRSAKPVKPDTLYGVIDAMPMRRAEMKQRSQATAAPTATPIPTPRKPDLDHDE